MCDGSANSTFRIIVTTVWWLSMATRLPNMWTSGQTDLGSTREPNAPAYLQPWLSKERSVGLLIRVQQAADRANFADGWQGRTIGRTAQAFNPDEKRLVSPAGFEPATY